MSRKSGKNQRQNSSSDNSLTSPANRPLVNNPPPGEESRKLLQISSQRQVTESFSGPLPPPQVLRQYNEIVPGLAGRIVAQAERQTEHRIQMESKVVQSDISKSWAGLVCGFVLSLCCIVGGIICVLQGHDWAGAAIITTSLAGLAGTFIYGTATRKAERTEKTKILAGKND